MTIPMLLAGLILAAGASQPSTSADGLCQALGFTSEERNALRQGEIVSHTIPELSDKELAITMAMLVPASLTDLLDFARSGKELEINRDILAHGLLGDGAAGEFNTQAFRDVGFAPSEANEIRDLFEVGAGSRFNLSRSELQRFAELRKKFPTKECVTAPGCANAVVALLQDVLRDRLLAYRELGLSGIEPYARASGGSSSPADDLRGATNAARFLAHEYPQVFDAFLNYPKGDQWGIESQFLWLKQKVQDHPTFILAHRFLCVRDGMAFAAERQFYVGGSYNSLQILYGLFPADGKTLVFYVNRTSTDQVAGFPTGTRHSMGRKIMEKEVRKHFEQVLASLANPPR